jgi:hypothetical protein
MRQKLPYLAHQRAILVLAILSKFARLGRRSEPKDIQELLSVVPESLSAVASGT